MGRLIAYHSTYTVPYGREDSAETATIFVGEMKLVVPSCPGPHKQYIDPTAHLEGLIDIELTLHQFEDYLRHGDPYLVVRGYDGLMHIRLRNSYNGANTIWMYP